MEAALLMVHVCTFAKGTTFGAVHLEHLEFLSLCFQLLTSDLQL